jgi:WD40 repeat protein
MKIIKNILLPVLLLMQGLSFGATAAILSGNNLSETVDVVCANGALRNLPVTLLVNNFEYFRSLFSGRFQIAAEIRVEGTKEELNDLLFNMNNPKFFETISFEKIRSLAALADILCMEKGKLVFLKKAFEESDEGRENFLSGDTFLYNFFFNDGVDQPAIFPIRVQKEALADKLEAISLDGHYGVRGNRAILEVCEIIKRRSSHELKVIFTIPRGDYFYSEKVLFSPTSTLVCVGGEKTPLQFWDIASHTLVAQSKECLRPFEFSPDGKWLLVEGRKYQRDSWLGRRLASSGPDVYYPSVYLYNVVENKIETVFPDREEDTRYPHFSNDSRFLAWFLDSSNRQNKMLVFDLVSRKRHFQTDPGHFQTIKFSPDNRKICVTSCVRGVWRQGQSDTQVFDLVTKERILDRGDLENFHFTADPSQYILTFDNDGRFFFFYDTDTRQLVSPGIEGQVCQASSDGKNFIFTDRSHAYSLINLFSNDRLISLGFDFCGLKFSDDGSKVLTLKEAGMVEVFDSITGQLLYELQGGFSLSGIDEFRKFSSEGNFLIVQQYRDGETIIHFPLEASPKDKYLFEALQSKYDGKLDRLPFSAPELKAMFDHLPRKMRAEILTEKGRTERVMAKQVAGIYGRMKQSSENKCRELQVYKSA